MLTSCFKGTDDVVFSFAQAESEIKLFANSPSTKLVRCEGGVHFLGKTHAKKIQQEVLDFVFTWNGNGKPSL